MDAPPAARHVKFIHKLSSYGKKNRIQLLKTASLPEIMSLCECVANVYKRYIPVSGKDIKRLKPFRRHIKNVVKRDWNLERKRSILIQKGGFLPIIAALAVPILTQLASNLFS